MSTVCFIVQYELKMVTPEYYNPSYQNCMEVNSIIHQLMVRLSVIATINIINIQYNADAVSIVISK